ncbi:SDR family oxidoreductase [Sphingobium phenoxybenzoativorans]|uniref:SDR family oxidoreductase n=1 Tax=Sphingobium phenoxybenzoativorans TaxID=1592790 RepID=A0A975K6Y9_9SPHN|nr:SDR family oxidoreductase [Sphingobium phenoxybenzoativorans]QUT04612.1 SDR family oxidoreductase [Sphingobium phenoxybenzoativorans]
MEKTHSGRVAIVTGAARGIGQAIAVTLARRGAKLILVDMLDSTETSEMIEKETGAKNTSVTADITSPDAWQQLAKTADEMFGRGDIVVNNAGIYPMCPLDELDDKLWRKTFAVNIDAHFYSAKAFAPLMRREKWGRFVNISSNSIGYAIPGMSHYMASKMAVLGFVRGLANELGVDGITVNAVLPAPTETPGTAFMSAENKEMLAQTQAIKRISVPDDLAGPVAFLTSDDAAFITGQSVVVDGGAYKIS